MAEDAVPNPADAERRIYIREAAELLNRQMSTLRKWEQIGVLPQHLWPHRGYRGWRYWTPEQIEELKDWLKRTNRVPGKGLPHYNPTEASLERALDQLRRPRKCVLCEEPIGKGDRWTRLQGKGVHLSCAEIKETSGGRATV